jgi:hypothetical protein
VGEVPAAGARERAEQLDGGGGGAGVWTVGSGAWERRGGEGGRHRDGGGGEASMMMTGLVGAVRIWWRWSFVWTAARVD